MPDPDPALIEEVRVGMALNGGVSLAVWMGGCVAELDCARRAHLGPEAIEPEPGVAEPPPPRTIYHALCRAFRRELVFDLMSGSSAGGVNGALLATAIVKRRRLHPRFLRDRWIGLGDFSSLLHSTANPEPTSLMDGEYFLRGLEDAFKALAAPETEGDRRMLELSAEHAQKLAGTVALDVTTTDVAGRERVFRDRWGEPLVANEYRARFRFRGENDYVAERLAWAARSSASFPLAFEPSSVPAGVLPGVGGPRWAIDGGVLDNAPIRAVLELIPTRPATRQVQRYVCYMNADPALPVPAHGGDPPVPTLEQVLGYALNLPRKAPMVDQLDAVERAVAAGEATGEAEGSLVKAPLAGLKDTARELLDAYRARRRLLSLREQLSHPHEAAVVNEKLGGALELPWIPTTLDAPGAGEWGWGTRAAQRAIHLTVDLVRHAAKLAGKDDRVKLFELRSRLDEQLQALDAVYAEVTAHAGVRGILDGLASDADVAAELQALADLMHDPTRDPAIRRAVETAAREVLAHSDLIARLTEPAFLKGLFGDGWTPAAAEQPLTEQQLTIFLSRTLAVEVVRRAFAGDDVFATAQRLAFAQLTPCAPAVLFAPAGDERWDRPGKKLTGVNWGHFAAFYRASWRSNDFMWGRLDAAVRVMDLLVDPRRAQQVVGDGGKPPSEVLAAALLPPDADETRRALIAEELGLDPGAQDLAVRLRERLAEDLNTDGSQTRRLCARAAQLEILIHELPLLVAYSRADVKLGTAAPALDIDTTRPWIETINAIRGQPTFPERLGGKLKDEAASPLAMRTSTHAAFVSLAALRTTKRPLTRALFSLRAPLLPVAGLVSRNRWYQAAVVLAFWAMAVLVDGRMAKTVDGDPPLSDIWSPPVLATLLALVGVASVAAVPGLRAARAGSTGRRLAQIGWLALVAAVGGAAGIVWLLATGVSIDAMLAQHGAEAPPDELLGVAIAVTIGVPIALPFPFIRKAVDKLLNKPWGGPSALVVTLGPWLAVGVLAWLDALDAALDFDGWKSAIAALGVIGAPVTLLAYLLVSRTRLRRR